MTVTVLPIIEHDNKPAVPLAKVMNERLSRFAAELQDLHLKELVKLEPLFEDVVIYISYNANYAVRWKVVNDVSSQVELIVAEQCNRLGYIKWKTTSVNTFNGNKE